MEKQGINNGEKNVKIEKRNYELRKRGENEKNRKEENGGGEREQKWKRKKEEGE